MHSPAKNLSSATVSADGLTVHLVVDKLVVGHIHELHLPGLRDRAGKPLVHDVAYYTLNQIPAPRSGTVTHILIEDGQPVEFGEPLVVIE